MVLELANSKKEHVTGWAGIGTILLAYIALYTINFVLPLRVSNYTTRIWAWTQVAVTLTAVVVVIRKRRLVKPGAVLLGIVLAVFSALSLVLHDPSISAGMLEGLGVCACFLGGVTLFKEMESPGIPAFQLPPAKIIFSILFGVFIAIPLAAINNLYFYLNTGAIQFQNIFVSAFEALSPAVHEEIIFRFFILALCFRVLPPSTWKRMIPAIFLSVVPHSLNHLPDLLLQDPLIGLFMLAATSLLFGLPMALLQVKKNLEAAVAFHWFIDFVRFVFGY